MSEPWEDWIPGVLANQQIRELEKRGYLVNLQNPDEAIDASAVDLHLGSEAYETLQGSIKPFGEHYLNQIRQQNLIKEIGLAKSGAFELKRGKTYVFEVREHLEKRKELTDAGMYGQATPKSSVGRMDVLVRLIVDYMDAYDGFMPGQNLLQSTGQLFLEATPITFNVKVRPGDTLSQLRFIYGRPEDCEVKGEQVARTALGREDTTGFLSVDLEPVNIGKKHVPAIAFRAKEDQADDSYLELWDKEKYDPRAYWHIEAPQGNGRLTIRQNAFYILRSKEKIQLPKGVAVYCRAVDETIGEMRIHYAGFVHPNFGRERQDGKMGTPLIFEVRGHDLDVSLKDGQTMAHIQFYRMSADPEIKGKKKDKKKSSPYDDQTLQLSKFFKPWK